MSTCGDPSVDLGVVGGSKVTADDVLRELVRPCADSRRTVRPRRVPFDVGLFRALADGEAAALQAAGDRYGTLLGLEATLVTMNRGRR